MKNMKDEMPETTQRHFEGATAAILGNVGKFAQIALEAENRAAIVQLGQHITNLLNEALNAADRQAGQNKKYMQMQ